APGHVELLLGNVLDRAARSEAVRVVHQDVDRAVPADGLLDHRLHVAALPDVDHRRHALATVRADLLRRALGTVKLDLRDADLGTLAREEERDGATDALTRSRHDGDLAVEAAHFLPLSATPQSSQRFSPEVRHSLVRMVCCTARRTRRCTSAVMHARCMSSSALSPCSASA